MKISLTVKFILAFSTVAVIAGMITTAIGLHIISTSVVREAQDKVRTDLNAAREIYKQRLKDIENILTFTAMRKFAVQDALLKNDRERLLKALEDAKRKGRLDILTLTDPDGHVVLRAGNPGTYGDSQKDDEIVSKVLLHKKVFSSTQIVSREELKKEAKELAERAYMKFIPTPKAKPRPEKKETSGMMLKAAAPIFDEKMALIGVLYGGCLINGNYEIVDTVKDIVYQGLTYKGKDVGTATIFQGDLRISTNVRNTDGTRAVATRVSEEVNNKVLGKGKVWMERAFVVNNWYITAYEPIKNIDGRIIGMLYVGMLEDKYVDMKNRTMWIFLGITFLGIVFAVIFSCILASSILKPVKHLVSASKQLAKGDFSYRVELDSKDEIGELGETFNSMASSLKERDEQLKERAQRQIMESERLATIGQLAAGVAHEINNPLGGILVYSHLLLEDTGTDDPRKANLEKIVKEAMRCKEIIRGLLDFAHQTEPKVESANINKILKDSFALLEHQVLFQDINIDKRFAPSLPEIMVDKNQIQQIFINIILNAAEAMEGKGDLFTATRVSKDGRFIEIEFSDTGCGIPEENIERLFEPFFTTKEIGHGTGLGLSISFGIIERHKGTIEVKSQVGKGATFIISLPVKETTPLSRES